MYRRFPSQIYISGFHIPEDDAKSRKRFHHPLLTSKPGIVQKCLGVTKVLKMIIMSFAY